MKGLEISAFETVVEQIATGHTLECVSLKQDTARVQFMPIVYFIVSEKIPEPRIPTDEVRRSVRLRLFHQLRAADPTARSFYFQDENISLDAEFEELEN